MLSILFVLLGQVALLGKWEAAPEGIVQKTTIPGQKPTILCQKTTIISQKTQPLDPNPRTKSDLDFIRISPDKTGFQTAGKNWRPWGFNYDHDHEGRLIEDYWDKEWANIEGDFTEMRDMGVNAVRIHLQVGKFLDGPDTPNQKALKRLRELCDLARKTGLRLNLTGLGCYHKNDVPPWYDQLDEKGRWKAQAIFWKAIAREIRNDPVVFCLDLMNEPVVPGGKRQKGDWLGPPFGGKHFVQVISLDQAARPRPDIAKSWIDQLVREIRTVDSNHLITVGLVDWSLDRPGLTSGFVPEKTCQSLDFLSVHLYPKRGKLAEARQTLKGFQIGKPLVLEETFALECPARELGDFLKSADKDLAGVFSFYWGKPLAELKQSKSFGDAFLRDWLEVFLPLNPNPK